MRNTDHFLPLALAATALYGLTPTSLSAPPPGQPTFISRKTIPGTFGSEPLPDGARGHITVRNLHPFDNLQFVVTSTPGQWAPKPFPTHIPDAPNGPRATISGLPCEAGNTCIALPSKAASRGCRTYYFWPVRSDDCETCRKWWRDHFPSERFKFLDDCPRGIYSLEVSLEGTYFINDPAGLLAIDRDTRAYAESLEEKQRYASPLEAEGDDFLFGRNYDTPVQIRFANAPEDIDKDRSRNVDDKFRDHLYKLNCGTWRDTLLQLPGIQELAVAAYTADAGMRYVIPSVRNDHASVGLRRSDCKTYIRGSGPALNSGDRNHLVRMSEYTAIEVIEGGSLFDVPRKHPVLGDIPASFRAVIFSVGPTRAPDGPRVIAFAGTGGLIDPDWIDNFGQGLPMITLPLQRSPLYDPTVPYGTIDEVKERSFRVGPQYAFAIKVAKYVFGKNEVRPLESGTVGHAVIGHSLGGGLANYVSCMLGVRGFGFNAAALASGAQDVSSKGVPFPDLYFTHVRSRFDPVSLITPSLPYGINIGDVITVGSHAPFWSEHGILTLDCTQIVDYVAAPSAWHFARVAQTSDGNH